MSFNIFGPATKNDIRVGYISTERGFVDGVSVCQANDYAKKNPGTQFVFRTRDKIQYLNINEVNTLTPDKLLPSSSNDCPGIQLETDCGPSEVYFYGGGGIGAKANPIIGKDGSLLAVDLVTGGFGYQYAPVTVVKDNCGIGAGVVVRSVIGEVVETVEYYDQEDDFEDYQICEPTESGYGKLYSVDGKDIGEWDPTLYANFTKDPIRREIQEYQKFLTTLRGGARVNSSDNTIRRWWTTRTEVPLSVTSLTRTTRVKHDVSHPGWGQNTPGEWNFDDIADSFMNRHAISPVPPSNVSGTDYAGITFTMEWEKEFPYSGDYTFRGMADNLGNVYLDNQLLFTTTEFRKDHPPVKLKKTITEGVHRIRIDLYNVPIIENATAPAAAVVSKKKSPDLVDVELTVKAESTSGNGSLLDNIFFTFTSEDGKDSFVIKGKGKGQKSPGSTNSIKPKFINDGNNIFLDVSGNGSGQITFKMDVDDKFYVNGVAAEEVIIPAEGSSVSLKRNKFLEKEVIKSTGKFKAGQRYGPIKIIGAAAGAGKPTVTSNQIGLIDADTNKNDLNIKITFDTIEPGRSGTKLERKEIVKVRPNVAYKVKASENTSKYKGVEQGLFKTKKGDTQEASGEGNRIFADFLGSDNDNDDIQIIVGTGKFKSSNKRKTKDGSRNTYDLTFKVDKKVTDKSSKKISSKSSTSSQDSTTKTVFNTVDYIQKADRQLWRCNVYGRGGFINEYGVSPFDTTVELKDNPYAGTHRIVWDNVEFPTDGNYIIEIEVDDNVSLTFQGPDGETVITKKGFNNNGQSTGKTSETRAFTRGKYKIIADLEQIPGGVFAFSGVKGSNPMALAINVESADLVEEVISPKSWNENPMGAALVIDAPLPPVPQEPVIEQEGRCPNNPIWSTRFPGSTNKWIPVRFDPTRWSQFMNRYAISPVLPLSQEDSDGGGIIYRNSWNLDIPYDGFYALRGTVDNAGRILIDGKEIIRSGGLNFKRTAGTVKGLDGFATENPQSNKVFLTKGMHSIEVEVENEKTETFVKVDQKVFNTADWISPSKSDLSEVELTIKSESKSGNGSLLDNIFFTFTSEDGKDSFVLKGRGNGQKISGTSGSTGSTNSLKAKFVKVGDDIFLDVSGTGSNKISFKMDVDDKSYINGIAAEEVVIPAEGSSISLKRTGTTIPFSFAEGSRQGQRGETGGTIRNYQEKEVIKGSGKFKAGQRYGPIKIIGASPGAGKPTVTSNQIGLIDADTNRNDINIKITFDIDEATTTTVKNGSKFERKETIKVRPNVKYKVVASENTKKYKGVEQGLYKTKKGDVQETSGKGNRIFADFLGSDNDNDDIQIITDIGEFKSSNKRKTKDGSRNTYDLTFEVKSADTTNLYLKTGKTLNGATYKGTTLASYKNGSLGPFLTPAFDNDEDYRANNMDKTWTLIWDNVDFPVDGQYTLKAEADDYVIVKIDGVEIGKAEVFQGVRTFNFNTTKGKKKIEMEIYNIPGNSRSTFETNPIVFSATITVPVNKATGLSRPWTTNPVGISAILIPPPCPKRIKGKGVVTEVIVDDPGNGNPSFPNTVPPTTATTYPVTLRLKSVIVENPGINYNCGVDQIQITPSNGAVLSYDCDSFGRIRTVNVLDPGLGFTTYPEITMVPPDGGQITGVNASFRPQFEVVRDPIVADPAKLIQVTDLVGLKQTGYVDGRAYFGAVFYKDGVRYAGFYETPGELVQVYDTLQESIDAQVVTRPSAILRQGTDTSSNNPRLNLPGTPDTLI